MQEATPATILGDTGDPAVADFNFRYTFGISPLQQYLVPLPGGRLQAFGIAWDSRPAENGGQHWFDLYPGQDLEPGDPLHWTGIDQTWNYQCADCHSTNLRKNYDSEAGEYQTTWSEISVGCEACHGPASRHINWANKAAGWRDFGDSRGLTVALDERRGITWIATATGSATRSAPRVEDREIGTCAHCHARRGQYADDIHAGDNWLDAFRPALLDPGLYHADGQQRDEVYTWGSFVQSRMYAAGVTCADCHDPHSGQLRAPGNAVCAQCHLPAIFDTTVHHHHSPDSPGAQCTSCHMPATTYMIVDPRRDHSLRIPRPDRSVTIGTPNACNDCHRDREPQWAADAIRGWFLQPRPGYQTFAEAFAMADQGSPAAVGPLLDLADDPKQAALVRASAIARAASFREATGAGAVVRALGDGDALVRSAAVEALGNADAATRANRLTGMLGDPVRLVRMAAARALAGEPESLLPAEARSRFTAALDEWIAAQRFNADRPESLTNLGALYLERGAVDEAAALFSQAIKLDPTFIQASVNLADVRRARGDEAGAEQTLREALMRNPDAAALHHALGLSLIRQGRTADALAALKDAQRLEPGHARFAFVYAVALHDTGKPAAAISSLRGALRRHPYDRDMLAALAAYEREPR
jgi:predicted CXXCH cytochrome family protein